MRYANQHLTVACLTFAVGGGELDMIDAAVAAGAVPLGAHLRL
jgi:hypothetical protein